MIKFLIMKGTFKQKVYYADTDAYGVVWHGSYLRWLEMGRVLLCEMFGQSLSNLAENDIVLPVTSINIAFKSSAKLEDEMIIETTIEECSRLSMTFKQIIRSESTEKVFVEALVKIVAVHNDGSLYRTLPKVILDMYEWSKNEN